MTKSDFSTANLLTRSIKSYFDSLQDKGEYLARTEFKGENNQYRDNVYIVNSKINFGDMIEGKVYTNEEIRSHLGEFLIKNILDRLTFRANVLCGMIGLAAILTGYNIIAIIVLGIALFVKWYTSTVDKVDKDVYRYTPIMFVDDDGEEMDDKTDFMFVSGKGDEIVEFLLTPDTSETDDEDFTKKDVMLTLAALIDEAEDEGDTIRVRSLQRIEHYIKGNV